MLASRSGQDGKDRGKKEEELYGLHNGIQDLQ